MTDVFEEIYTNYKKLIYNYFYKSTFNKPISEELTQDTFLKAFKYFSGFKGESNVKTWLFKIARNTYINYINKNNKITYENIETLELGNKIDDYCRSNEKIIIRKILYKLSEKERTLILLRDLNKFSYKEISKILNFSEGKVKIGIHRARKKF